jgi:hypothetical protein
MSDLQKYQAAAEKAFESFYGQPYRMIPAENDKPHIINIGRSVMLHRDGVLLGGGFVSSVCANDLCSAVERADSVCQQHLTFFVYCKQYVHP